MNFPEEFKIVVDIYVVIRGTREIGNTTKKRNLVSALGNYYRTGDEANLVTDVPSMSGKLFSEQKRPPLIDQDSISKQE